MNTYEKQEYWLAYQLRNVYGKTKMWWVDFAETMAGRIDYQGESIQEKACIWMAQQLALIYNDNGTKWLKLAKESTDKMKEADLLD